jgi:hypothetical protein
MKTTRKNFLATVATGLAAAALRPSALLAASEAPTPAFRAFKSLVGQTFTFRGPDGRGPVDLVLSDYAESPRFGSTQFTLTLVAPGGETLGEGTYTVDQARTGTFQMFVIPTGRDAKGQTTYRADFNLLVTVTSVPAPVHKR